MASHGETPFFFREAKNTHELRERKPKDKIKRKSGGRSPKEPRRQLTAKFRKELTKRQRSGSEETSGTQAVNQTEEITTAAVEEVSERAGQSVSDTAAKIKEYRQEKRREQGQRQKDPFDTRAGATPSEEQTAPEPPTPQDCMRQQAVDERQKQRRQPGPKESPPESGTPGRSPHYGGSPSALETPKEHRSLENQSINQSIKERPRRSTGPKEKPTGGAFTPKTRKSIEQAAQKAATSAKTTSIAGKKPATKQVMERARRKARQEAQRKMAQQTQKTVKAVADLSKKATLAVGRAVAAMISALAGLVGGGVLVAALCVVFLIAAIIVSPFGILFSNEPSQNAIPLNAAVSQINMELTDKLDALQAGDYDSIDIQGQAPDWREVVAVFAVKTAGADDGVDVAALTPDRVERLRAIFWDMCIVTSEVEQIDHPGNGEDDDGWTEYILHITITAKTADDMRTAYTFSNFQNQSLTELLAELNTLDSLLGDLSISQENALALLHDLPDDLSPERKAVIKVACSLVGKVNYFWGGKSLVIGWDSRWGTLQKVTAADSSTTGTYRPYGLDCSGFVDWAFYNATDGSYIIGHGGGVHAQHTYCTDITWDEAIPGDLVFYPDDEHIGIVGGRDEAGNLLIIHCASSANNVVITGADGFVSIARPNYYPE